MIFSDQILIHFLPKNKKNDVPAQAFVCHGNKWLPLLSVSKINVAATFI